MKVLKVVGMVVGAVALVATGVGIAMGGLTAAASATASTLMTVGAVAGVVSGAIGLAAALLAPKPSFSSNGNPQQFQTNPQSGLPYCFGRTAMAGLRVHGGTTARPGWTKYHDILGFAVLLSVGGAISHIEKFAADGEVVSLDWDGTGQAIGRYSNYMAQRRSLGAPGASALALSLGGAAMPGWDANHKLSGTTHALWMLRYNEEGDLYSAGVPQPKWIGHWVKCYDPRLDSTYPGGSGAHRSNDETTWAWTRNPALHALTWCLGRRQNGKLTVGIGAPVGSIRVADFVEAANVADANGWGIGGVAWSTDAKWTVLKSMLQAGGAVPTMTGAMIGCRVNMPRVSAATISAADLLDRLRVSVTKPRRERINTVFPRYVSEANDWQVVTGAPVAVSAYVTADGETRSTELDLPYVQAEVDQAGFDGELQAGQLAAYDIVNAREAGPISFSTGPKWLGLKCGDCITLDVPAEGLSSAKVILTSDPVYDPATGRLSFTAETETDAKHAFALGQSSAAPPPFTPTVPDLKPPTPVSGDWSYAAALNGDGLPELRLTGSNADPSWDAVLVRYRKVGAPSWTFFGSVRDPGGPTIVIPGVDGATQYEASVAYGKAAMVSEWLDLAAVTTGDNGLSVLIADAQATADAKRTVFYQATAPSHLVSEVNDLWINSADGNRLYRRVDGTGRLAIGGDRVTIGGNYITLCWTMADDQRVGQAILDAAGAQATADGKVQAFTMFASTDPVPVGTDVGDLLYRLYTSPVQVDRWDGDSWEPVATYGATAAQIASIGQALTDAANAQATADGKIDTFYQTAAPSGSVGDLWFDTDDGNKQYRHNGTNWVAVQDAGIGQAISDAAGAQATADGKVVTFVGELTPTAEGVGDLWYKASDKTLRRWNGSAWAVASPTNVADGATVGAPSGTNVGGASADTVASAATNFNGRNDRLSATPTAPTIASDGTAVDHAVNTGGSADISFEWSWGGTESDIDGFEVLVYASTSSSAYTLGTTPAAEQTFFMAAAKRAFLIYGIDPTLYYTFAVRAYRIVDADVNSNGIIRSAWVKPSLAAENPYRPASSVAFAGNVTGTVDGSAAATVASGALAANNGVNSDGTIKNDKVTTPAVAADAVTKPYQGSNGSSWSGTGIGTYSTVVSYNVVMDYAGDIILMGSLQITHSGQSWAFDMMVDPGTGDVSVQSGSGNVDHYVPMQGRYSVAGAGTYAVKIKIAGAVGASLNAGAASLVALRRYK